MRKTIAAAAVAASIAAGGLVGSVLGAPLAGATETAGSAVTWVQEALIGLVDDGTITQDQADAVQSALDEARPERGPGWGHGPHGAGHVDLAVVAEALGVTEDELRTALAEGRSIADLAAAEGVEVQAVVDALVAAHQERLAAAVADGGLTQEEADERAAAFEERAAALVDGELVLRPGAGRAGHGHGPRGGPWADEEDGADADA